MEHDETELQREAVAFAKQHGHFLKLPLPQAQQARRFLVKLADFLNWYDLQQALK